MILAVTESQALWYMTRGSGLVSILLLTLVVALGVAQVHGAAGPSRQRFVITQIHRNASLFAVVFIGIHIATSILDGFAPIHWLDAVIPFRSPYRPIWVGLGTLAFDLVLTLVITSLLRLRIGFGTWRSIHWLAYACWPIAFLHGLGTGSDGRVGLVQLVDLACLVVVVLAIAWRLTRDWQHETAIRAGSAVATVVFVTGMSMWAYTGPMQKGWAKKAGTPTELLSGGSSSAETAASTGLVLPFSGDVVGTLEQNSTTPGTNATITLTGTVVSGSDALFVITLTGPVSSRGGLSMRSSTVTMGPPDQPRAYSGTITHLEGTRIEFEVTDAAGDVISADVQLQVSDDGASFTGTIDAVR
jgi:DMSO/TMAO reductase YedYZ heme-binding membrane subunit